MRKHKSQEDEEKVILPFGPPAVDAYTVFKDIEFLRGNTPDGANMALTEEDKEWIDKTVTEGKKTSPPPSLAALRYLEANFSQYNFDLPVTQAQWQNFVLTKLVEQANDLDPKIAKPALDTLAKTSVVGLMVDKQEISITHKTSEELESTLRNALNRYLGKNEKVIEGVATRA